MLAIVRRLFFFAWHCPVIHNFMWHIVHSYPLLQNAILISWTRLWFLKAVYFIDFSTKRSMWHYWLATLVSRNWLMHFSKRSGGLSCMRQWLPLSIRVPLVHALKTTLQSLLAFCSPIKFQNVAFPPWWLTLPPVHNSLIDITQFSLVWIALNNIQFSLLIKCVARC